MKILLVLLAASALAAAPQAVPMDAHVFLNQAELKWGAAPPSLPSGAQLAVLYGDPDKEGTFTIRMSAPAGYVVPPHWHSRDEHLTVISGTLYLGSGEKADLASAKALEAGGYHFLPAKARHFAMTRTPTIVQISGQGPFDITYIDPADDPRAAPAK